MRRIDRARSTLPQDVPRAVGGLREDLRDRARGVRLVDAHAVDAHRPLVREVEGHLAHVLVRARPRRSEVSADRRVGRARRLDRAPAAVLEPRDRVDQPPLRRLAPLGLQREERGREVVPGGRAQRWPRSPGPGRPRSRSEASNPPPLQQRRLRDPGDDEGRTLAELQAVEESKGGDPGGTRRVGGCGVAVRTRGARAGVRGRVVRTCDRSRADVAGGPDRRRQFRRPPRLGLEFRDPARQAGDALRVTGRVGADERSIAPQQPDTRRAEDGAQQREHDPIGAHPPILPPPPAPAAPPRPRVVPRPAPVSSRIPRPASPPHDDPSRTSSPRSATRRSSS